MSTHNDVTEFLLKHGYIVKCFVYDNTVSCKYTDKIDNTYVAEMEGGYLRVYHKNDEDYEDVALSPHLVRWYIILDIMRECKKHNLSYNILKCFDKDGNENEFVDLLKLPLSNDDLQKEKALSTYIINTLADKETINDHDDSLQELGLLHSFNILKGLLI